MKDMSGMRVVQIGGGILAVVMLVLMRVGTHSLTTFITWTVLALVGAGIFVGARRLDEPARRARGRRSEK